MAKPVWTTDYNLSSYPAGEEISISLIAKSILPATSIVSYTLANGSLPAGTTLNINGLLSGTLSYVLSTTNYTFTVLATDNLGNSSTKTFVLTTTYNPIQPVWVSPSGTDLGSFITNAPLEVSVVAIPVLPATTISYTLISGILPSGLSFTNGTIAGTPTTISQAETNKLVIRATDNLGNIKDKTFTITINGSATPSFTTPSGILFSTNDSVWIEFPIDYLNPLVDNPIKISVTQGLLPPGLEINDQGIIRGYAQPPTNNVTVPQITTSATATSASDVITCVSTTNFFAGRPVYFTGATAFDNIEIGTIYYIKSVIDATSFTISTIQNGATFNLNNDTGFMTVVLPPVSVGQPTIRSYGFNLTLTSPLGNTTQSYSITVVNQNAPNGPNFLPNTRIPTIYNTRPPTYNLNDTDPYYGYYVLPVEGTYPPSTPAFIGTIKNDNFFAFKIIGHDFDGTGLNYLFADLPSFLTGNSETGWVTGTPSLSTVNINNFSFRVSVNKISNPAIQTPFFIFSFNVSNEINGDIVWVSPSSLGNIFNGSLSIKSVVAESDVELQYRIISGSLPPNLVLLSNGEITGYTAFQPTDEILPIGAETEFTFTVEAYSPQYPVVKSEKTFTITVVQEFDQPTDTLYIKCAPDIQDRNILESLLTNSEIFPPNVLYRPNDPYFGLSTSVIYEHAYGIHASDVQEYIAAVTRNHYDRSITLGEIKTAIARDENGRIIYEVVYSEIIDDLINPRGISIPEEIAWPRTINLNLGPWYTSITNIYTSYVEILGQQFYTSLTPGSANTLYPNSLPNMRDRVGQELGQEFDSRILPLWMTSQQENGSTLGYTPAWVICYTKPGYSTTVKTNIETMWLDPIGNAYQLNLINFALDRFTVDKSLTYNYDNFVTPPSWTGLPSGTPVPSPIDSKDFYVLFPRKTILPDQTQY
jgi:hypothetical protein